MRVALALSLLAALLSGCASHPRDPDGVWINQAAIDAAVKGGNLRQALLANGPNLEWQINTKAGQASFSNGFELGEGKITSAADGKYHIEFYGHSFEELKIKGDDLTQAASDSGPEQHFVQPKEPSPAGAPPGSSFEKALYTAYMGGKWKITDGEGAGSTVQFHPDGSVDGLPGNDRYALCLAGDCAAMSSENDSLWLEKNKHGNAWIFMRKGDKLEILQAMNQAGADDMPDLHPGPRKWLLERD
ncbi:hypothetical protein [Pseudomonas sp. NA-150]|uniref:hypothetical protein n=1 Tax=Pseudomonas sp. NA-150 TaxID=3367525 RepID=UPI0037C62C08